jgi:transposase
VANWLGMKKIVRRSRPRRVGRSVALPWRVSDSQWSRLESILVDPPRSFRYPGRLRYSARACLEGILYVLYTDTPWLQVPYRELGLPSGETCRRRLEEWSGRGLFEQALRVLQDELAEAESLDWSRLIIDASVVEAKKGAKRSRARTAAARAAATTSP